MVHTCASLLLFMQHCGVIRMLRHLHATIRHARYRSLLHSSPSAHVAVPCLCAALHRRGHKISSSKLLPLCWRLMLPPSSSPVLPRRSISISARRCLLLPMLSLACWNSILARGFLWLCQHPASSPAVPPLADDLVTTFFLLCTVHDLLPLLPVAACFPSSLNFNEV